MSESLISVVITTFNTGRFLPETLESALAQTHRRTEIIVVDDGSTDNTPARVQPYLNRIRFLRQEHGGLASARNAGLRIAEGAYISLLDADDLWAPEKLAVQLAMAQRVPESGMIACDGEEFGGPSSRPYLLSGAAARALHASPQGEITRFFHSEFIKHVNIRCPAQTLFPRWVIEQTGPFGDFYAQDYDYYLRVSSKLPVTFHAHSLVRWRDRPDSMSGSYSRRDLTWSRQKLVVLRAYAKNCEPQFREAVDRQLIWNRAEVAFQQGDVFGRERARRVMVSLLGRQPWPPVAAPFLLASTAPRLARTAHRLWTRWIAHR